MFEQLTSIFLSTQTNLDLASISQKQREDYDDLSIRIKETPWLSLSEIHKICLEQERKVINRIMSIKPIDLYEQIGNACPDFADLKKMPIDQVKTKIIQLTYQNIQKEQSMKEQDYELQNVSILQQNQDDFNSLNQIVSEEYSKMQLIEEDISNEKIKFEKDIDNMFTQESHTGLPWTDFGFYGTEMSD